MPELGELTPVQPITPVTPGKQSGTDKKAPTEKPDRDKPDSASERRRRKDDENPSHIDAYV
jgi:hypothetical protein